jgi:serine/threonine-protein kinase HipA
LSAYPILGLGTNQVAPQKATMAMAAIGKNRHYRWAEIQPRHWLTTAAAIGLDTTGRHDILELAGRVAAVVREVSAVLPADFPPHVAEPIFAGLQTTARRLADDVA